MSRTLLSLLLAMVVGLGFAVDAQAGAKLMINDDASLDLGIRIQPLIIYGDQDVDGDGSWDSDYDMKVRRARLRLKAVIGEYVEGFIQTDVSGSAGGAGQDARVIDAFVVVKPHQWFQFYTGLNMVPVYRQNLTSSGALMAMDRPGITYKNLSWGNRAVVRMANNTLAGTASGLTSGNSVRDEGLTLFGSGALGESNANLKYYVGVYDGINASGETDPRFAGRAQINFFDAEGGYYNSSTYLGKKKTVGIGAAFDLQNAIASDVNDELVDYKVFTADGFIEWPLGEGSLTAEAGWQMLDLGDATVNFGGSDIDWNAVQGTGFYGQAGYLFGEHWQPWGEFETWSSDSDADVGNYTAFRLGVSYYIMGHNANIKLGYEMVTTDVPMASGSAGEEDSMNTFILGTYITY